MPSDPVTDAQRVAAHLWGDRRRSARGPAPALTVGRIVDAALEVIDADGLDGMSMRQVASRLGVGAATLYTYVPGKAELLALVIDESVGRQGLPHEQSGDWRERTEAWAREDYADYRARPWLLRLLAGPVVAGPNMLRWYDSALRVVDGVGLTPREMVGCIAAVDAYVRGQARAAAGEAPAAPDAAERPPLPTLYPMLERLRAADAFDDPDATFEFGLARLLDGVAALIEERAAGA